MVSQTTTIEDLHDLYPADISYWSQVTTQVYVSWVWQMIIGVVERLVVAYCSTVAKISWTELEANWNRSRTELELELTIARAGIVFILPETDLRDTSFLLLMSRERPFQILVSVILVFSRQQVGLTWHPGLNVQKHFQDKQSKGMQNSYIWKPLAIVM